MPLNSASRSALSSFLRVFFSAPLVAWLATGEGVVHLVEGPLGVQAHPDQPVLVAVLHHVRGAPEGPVLLHAHGEHPMVGTVRVPVGLVGQDVAHLGLVRVGRQQVDVVGSRLVRGPLEVVARVEVDIVALLGETPAGLAVKVDPDVVVELPVVEERATGAGIACRPRSGFWMNQCSTGSGLVRLGSATTVPSVLRGVQRIEEGREPRRRVRRCPWP